MDVVLTRVQYLPEGIFSELRSGDGQLIAHTLEHAYQNPKDLGYFVPKIPDGHFLCVRGEHQLHGMLKPFVTFEITGVEGHTNLLFHAGNFNKDSEGCVLLGENVAKLGTGEMITNSRATFDKFMNVQQGVLNFFLTVRS